MNTYQDHEIMKRNVRLKIQEYFYRKNELNKFKYEVLQDIKNYEDIYGQTSHFDDMKQEIPEQAVKYFAPGQRENDMPNWAQPKQKKQKPKEKHVVFKIIVIIILLIMLYYVIELDKYMIINF